MAVLLDGPAWARRGTVGDRDGLPVEVLGDMLRWPVVERVWLPSWLASRDAVLERLVEAVDAVPSEPVAEPIQLPTAAQESFKGVAALRSSVTASVAVPAAAKPRSEEHTSELQSRQYLVCRLLLEKKNYPNPTTAGAA